MSEKLSRRKFLRVAAVGAGALLVASCQPTVVEKIVKETVVVEKEVEKEVEKVITATPAPAMAAALEVWAYPSTENDLEIVWEPLITKFNDINPFIVINMDVQPWGGRREKLYAACAAGAPPDLWRGTNDTTPTYVQKGIIVDLTDLVPAEALADYSEGEIAAGSYEGKLYLLMTSQQIMGYGYNGKILRECGYDPADDPIVTWDDLLALGEKAKAKDYYVEAVDTYSWPQWIRCIHQAGGTVYAADKSKSLMTEQPAIDLLTRYVTEFENGYVPLEGAVSSPEAGRAVPNYWDPGQQATMHTQTCGYCARIAKDDPEFEFVMASPRQRKAGDPLTSGNNSGDGFCITSASEHKEAALEWGLFTIWPENIGLFVTLADLAPVGTESQKFWKTEPCTKAWVAQNSKCQFTNQDSMTLWQESKVICAPHFQAAVLGKATVDEALEAIDEELNKTLIEVYG